MHNPRMTTFRFANEFYFAGSVFYFILGKLSEHKLKLTFPGKNELSASAKKKLSILISEVQISLDMV